MPFRVLEHTADLGIEVRAPTLDALFVDAAAGFADAITEVASIVEVEALAIELEEPPLDLLLVAWLAELLYQFDVAGLVLPRGEARFDELPRSFRVRGRLRGKRRRASWCALPVSPVAEEMPEAYKDVADVVDVVDRAGIARKVARLEPMGVIKG